MQGMSGTFFCMRFLPWATRPRAVVVPLLPPLACISASARKPDM